MWLIYIYIYRERERERERSYISIASMFISVKYVCFSKK